MDRIGKSVDAISRIKSARGSPLENANNDTPAVVAYPDSWPCTNR